MRRVPAVPPGLVVLGMARDPKARADIAALSVSERVLLFCLASGTAWQKAGVTEKTPLAMVIEGARRASVVDWGE